MRYQNWDVLLFPGDSRIPIQEFNTACHVITDQNSLAASKWGPSHDPFLSSSFESSNKTPILTCFVSSLPSGSSFRVSIHSWTKPGPSTILRSRKSKDEPIGFQIRLLVDGMLQSTRVFKEGVAWPEVIDFKDERFHGTDADLMFPAFHPEILQQPRWDPAEPLGRIQVVLTEGVLKESRSSQMSVAKVGFDRLRDVVAFAFQHAPQDVLEYSGIAWPNARLFENKPAGLRRPATLNTRSTGIAGPEAHAHSPQRLSGGREDAWGRMSRRVEASSKEYAYRSPFGGVHSTATPVVGALSGTNDPFFAPVPDSSIGWRSSARKTSTDDIMPDYASHSTERSRADTDMSVTWPRRDFQKHMDEAAVNEIIEALSPSKKGQLLSALSPERSSSSGIHAPINTPKTADPSRSPPEREVDGTTGSSRASSGQGVTTRSKKMIAMVQPVLVRQRGRSSSGSSKRKRSRSPGVRTGDKDSSAGATPLSKVQQKRKLHSAVETDSDSDKDPSIKSESRKSSAHGVPVEV